MNEVPNRQSGAATPDLRMMRRGVPAAVGVFGAGIVAFSGVELAAHPERAPVWISFILMQLSLSLAILWLPRWVERHLRVRSTTISLLLAIEASMAAYCMVVGGAEALVMGLVLVLAGVALLIPLGSGGQATVAGGAILSYLATLLAGVPVPPPPLLGLIALATAGGVTIVGAFILQQYRRETERAQQAALRETEVTRTLIEIGRELNETLSRPEVLRRLANRARELFGAPIGAISLIEPPDRLRITEVIGLAPEEEQAAKDLYVDLDSVPGALEQLSESLFEVTVADREGGPLARLLRLFGYQAVLIASIRRGTRPLGAVSFMYREPRGPFTTHERMLARGLAEQAALALDNAQLFERQQEAAEIATALLRVAEKLGGSLDPQRVEHDLAGLACNLLHGDGAAIYRPREHAWHMTTSVARSSTTSLGRLREFDTDGGTAEFLRELRRVSVVEITDGDTQAWLPPARLRGAGVRSALTTLLARGADPLAIIAVTYETRTGPFSSRERRVLIGLAQLGVVALTNAYLAEQLRRADRVKSEFVATMSHELRTPLNAILGYADLLRDQALGPIVPQQLDALDRLRERALDLLHLVQATLDLNRLEAGVEVVEWSDLELGDFLGTVRAQIPARWLKADVRLEFQSTEPTLKLRSDADKLYTVVRNLVHNALKFTQCGEIRVSAEPDPAHGSVVIEVRDTGCGIAPDRLEHIFDMFVQGDDSATHDGVGLGLHLCRRLVVLLGGQIQVESEVGLGSSFRVRLPLKPVAGAATPRH
jgi:signal transduction histidine kinase